MLFGTLLIFNKYIFEKYQFEHNKTISKCSLKLENAFLYEKIVKISNIPFSIILKKQMVFINFTLRFEIILTFYSNIERTFN